MKNILILIIAAAAGWFVFKNWESISSKKPTTDEYAMKEYKKSIDKARSVEETLKKAGQNSREKLKDF